MNPLPPHRLHVSRVRPSGSLRSNSANTHTKGPPGPTKPDMVWPLPAQLGQSCMGSATPTNDA